MEKKILTIGERTRAHTHSGGGRRGITKEGGSPAPPKHSRGCPGAFPARTPPPVCPLPAYTPSTRPPHPGCPGSMGPVPPHAGLGNPQGSPRCPPSHPSVLPLPFTSSCQRPQAPAQRTKQRGASSSALPPRVRSALPRQGNTHGHQHPLLQAAGDTVFPLPPCDTRTDTLHLGVPYPKPHPPSTLQDTQQHHAMPQGAAAELAACSTIMLSPSPH